MKKKRITYVSTVKIISVFCLYPVVFDIHVGVREAHISGAESMHF